MRHIKDAKREIREMAQNCDIHDWYGFTQTAEYANHVLPAIRQIAGYQDIGTGTYKVVPGNMEREELQFRENQLIDLFQQEATA